MVQRSVIDLPHARIEVEVRLGYLYVIETGELRTIDELRRYTRALEGLMEQTGLRRAVIDARAEIGDPPVDVRRAMWAWLVDLEQGFEAVAFVLGSEMAVARVNMTALAQRAPVRAFESVHQAQRWLTRGSKPSMSSLSPIPNIGKSTLPPPGDANNSAPPPRRPSSRPPPSDDDDSA